MNGSVTKSYQIAVYYFPNYHVDDRNLAQHGPGWTEWELVKRADYSISNTHYQSWRSEFVKMKIDEDEPHQ